jgi:hypothetical protein
MSESDLRYIIATAGDLIAGNIDVITGSRFLAIPTRQAKLADDPHALVILAVDSESDVYPLGAAREHWHPEALAEKDRKRERYAAQVHDDVIAACRGLVRIAHEELAKMPTAPA